MMARKNKLCSIINLTENSGDLRPLTNNRPIAALPFVGRYRLIDVALSNLSHAGIGSVALFIAKSGRSIYDHVRAGDAWNLSSSVGGGVFTFSQQNWKKEFIDESSDEDFYYNHRIYLKRSKAEYVYVAGSNIICNIDINALNQSHDERDKDVSLVYKQISRDDISGDHTYRRILTHIDNGASLIKVDNANPDQDGMVNMSTNMYMLSVEKLYEIIGWALEEKIYESIDLVIQHYIEEGRLSVNPYKYTGHAFNINSIQSYYDSNMSCLDDSNYSALFRSSQPILTKTKHGAPTYYGKDSLVQRAIIATDTRIEGSVKNSIVNRKVTIDKNASVEDSLILQGTKIGEGATVKYAIIDKDSVVEPGAQVIGSPDNLVVLGKNSQVKA